MNHACQTSGTVCLAALVLSIGMAARATTMAYISEEDCVRRATQIVHGVVASVDERTGEGGMAYVTVTLHVIEMLKGEADHGVVVIHQAKFYGQHFETGEEGVWFLENLEGTQYEKWGRNWVIGLGQGTFDVQISGNQKVVKRRLRFKPPQDKRGKTGKERDVPDSLPRFKEWVRQHMQADQEGDG